MKNHAWDDLNDSSKDFFDSAGFIPEPDFEEHVNDKHQQRRRLTELRRRTEERLDWKRTYGELQFDDLDHYDDFDDLDEGLSLGRGAMDDEAFDDDF